MVICFSGKAVPGLVTKLVRGQGALNPRKGNRFPE